MSSNTRAACVIGWPVEHSRSPQMFEAAFAEAGLDAVMVPIGVPPEAFGQVVGALGADWMLELLGIPVSAARRKCALLNLKVVRRAVTGDHAWPA